jgi:hypothetical protein
MTRLEEAVNNFCSAHLKGPLTTYLRGLKMKRSVKLVCLMTMFAPGLSAHFTCPGDVSQSVPITNGKFQIEANDLDVPDIFERQRIGPEHPAEDLKFGRNVALEGNRLFIAMDDNLPEGVPETVEIFTLDNEEWQRRGSVSSPNAHQFEHFYVLAVEGDLLLVGAPGHCAANPEFACSNGIAYVFERSPGSEESWSLVRELDGGFINDARFGQYADLDGSTAAIAADAETIGSVWGAGAIYIFERDQGGEDNWGLVKRIESDSLQKVEGDFFGHDVTVLGDTLLALGDDSSVLYEFGRNEGGTNNWGLVQKLQVPNGIGQIAFDGKTLAISSMDPCTPIEERKVWLAFYSRDDNGAWQQDQIIEGDYDPFRMRDIAVEGDILIAHTQDYDSAGYVFERSGNPEKWALKAVLQSSEPMQLRYGDIALDAGRAIVSYELADVGGRNDEGAVFFYETSNPVNTGHTGAWANFDTLGQGQLIDVDAENQFIFLSWFTYTDSDSANPNQQRWLTAQGNYLGSKAELPLFETLGGRFDDPQATQTQQVGDVTINFTDCGLARLRYQLDGEDLSGEFPIQRVIPGSETVCEQQAGNAVQSVDINAGMDGAWYDESTPGQGFLFDVQPDPDRGNFIFAAWFTYGDNTASGQRWLTAQGSFEGSTAEIGVYETTGGNFDDSQPTETQQVGTMQIDFEDCRNAQLSYTLDDGTGEGQIDLVRLLPNAAGLCEEFAGLE